MARIDDYYNAADLARRELASLDPDPLARFAGARYRGQGDDEGVGLDFLGKKVLITWPDVVMTYEDSKEEVEIQQQVLIFHYLQGAFQGGGEQLTGEWMAFQDVPDGRFYQDAFRRRAKIPLLQVFGKRPELMLELAIKAYGAEPLDLGDVSAAVSALPMIRVAMVLWAGDDEFPPDGNILFDRNTDSYLSAEDMAWISGMVVYPLLGMASNAQKRR